MRMFGPCDSAYAVNLTYNRHTDIYISPKISIEHPSVGLAPLTQLKKYFPLQGERAHSLKKKKVFDIKSKLIHSFFCSSFFLRLRANLSCVVATIFSSLAFLSTSISMANLSCLLATTFSRYRDELHRYRDTVHRYRDMVHRYRDVVHRYRDAVHRYRDVSLHLFFFLL